MHKGLQLILFYYLLSKSKNNIECVIVPMNVKVVPSNTFKFGSERVCFDKPPKFGQCNVQNKVSPPLCDYKDTQLWTSNEK